MIENLPLLRSKERFGMQNGLWCYDAYPELKPLFPKTSVEIANIKGPAEITCLHIAQPLMTPQHKRGVIIEAFFDDAAEPAIRAPLSDFFAEGLNGLSVHFSTPFVEKLPESYNCYMPMPFAKSARILLINETDTYCMTYSFVEYRNMPEWDHKLGYLHARWQRSAFQLKPDTVWNVIDIKGSGHLAGCNWSVITNEPLFKGFTFVMEGNVGYSIDGEPFSKVDYLGSEDSFCFSWGFRKPFCGLFSGISYVEQAWAENPFAKLAIYRFRNRNSIAFDRSLSIRIDWRSEFKNLPVKEPITGTNFRELLEKKIKADGGWIDYSTCYYWYDRNPGGSQPAIPTLDKRIAEFLGSVPKATTEDTIKSFTKELRRNSEGT